MAESILHHPKPESSVTVVAAQPAPRARTRRRATADFPRAIFGPFALTDGIVIGPSPGLWRCKQLHRDLLDLERAAALLDDRQVTEGLTRLFPGSAAATKALVFRRSGLDFLLALEGVEVWSPDGSRSGPRQQAWIRFREGDEAATRLLIERAWSSIVMAAWEKRAKDAKAVGLHSPKAPFVPAMGEGDRGSPAKTLLVKDGASPGSLVFATPSEAREIHRINEAISRSATWEEFKLRMPRGEYLELLPEIMRRLSEEGEIDCDEDTGEPLNPDPTGRFRYDMIPGYEDGDYPRWLQASMHHDLPDDIVRDFGTWEDTQFNGDFLEIKVADRLAVCRRLAAHGIRVLDGSRLSFH